MQKKKLKSRNITRKYYFQQSHLIQGPLSNIMDYTSLINKTLLDTSNICDMILESTHQLDELLEV
jgi:protoporphyrinogen oxidase